MVTDMAGNRVFCLYICMTDGYNDRQRFHRETVMSVCGCAENDVKSRLCVIGPLTAIHRV